jgi:hypothetical protein
MPKLNSVGVSANFDLRGLKWREHPHPRPDDWDQAKEGQLSRKGRL